LEEDDGYETFSEEDANSGDEDNVEMK